MEKITKELFALRDESYFAFHKKLIPEIPEERIIGVRTPALRAYAKEVAKRPEAYEFLQELPHTYYEENNLHGALLGLLYKDVESYLQEVEKFLPYIDNWATCDQFTPLLFKRHHPELLPYVRKWIGSDHPYTVRFAIKTLMDHYLGTDFDPGFPAMVCNAQADDYYVRMMVAWYFATALAKQYDAVLPYITEYRLPRWTHNKAIQKAVESYRITAEQKAFLKQYRLK